MNVSVNFRCLLKALVTLTGVHTVEVDTHT